MPYKILHSCRTLYLRKSAVNQKEEHGNGGYLAGGTTHTRAARRWQKQEIDALQQSVEAAERNGESLRSVFDRMSRQLGRKPNSIRNFYYAQVRAEQGEGGARAMPFETFFAGGQGAAGQAGADAKAQGVSVRLRAADG